MLPPSIPEYTCSMQKLIVQHSSFDYDPKNPIVVVSSSTTEVPKCVYWIDSQPVTVSGQLEEMVHGMLKLKSEL